MELNLLLSGKSLVFDKEYKMNKKMVHSFFSIISMHEERMQTIILIACLQSNMYGHVYNWSIKNIIFIVQHSSSTDAEGGPGS